MTDASADNSLQVDHSSKHGLLLALPAGELLERFGSGGHKPGSGSAAAISTLLACKMLRTVVKLTHERDAYKSAHAQLSLANQTQLDPLEPELMRIVDQDAAHFDQVVRSRRARDAATDPIEKRRLGGRALAELRTATEIPLRLAEYSLRIAETACVVFDLGFKSARGDSAVAISAALSGAFSALSIVYLNLQSFKGSEWAVSTRARTDDLMQRTQALHLSFVERIAQLQVAVQEAGGSDR